MKYSLDSVKITTQNTLMYFVHITTKHIITKLLTAQHYVTQCAFC